MKKEIKGFICGVIATSLIGCVSISATGIWDKIDVLRNDITVVVNGTPVAADNFLYNDTTYLPMRAIAEALGKDVQYDKNTNTAYIGEGTNKMGNTNQIQGKYPLVDQLNDQETFLFSMEVVDGQYYICQGGIREVFGLKSYTDGNNLIIVLDDGTEKTFPCTIMREKFYFV